MQHPNTMFQIEMNTIIATLTLLHNRQQIDTCMKEHATRQLDVLLSFYFINTLLMGQLFTQCVFRALGTF